MAGALKGKWRRRSGEAGESGDGIRGQTTVWQQISAHLSANNLAARRLAAAVLLAKNTGGSWRQ